jgi:transcriptional regulator with XRE-family HTH domain
LVKIVTTKYLDAYDFAQMSASDLTPILERQLLLQLGDRLKRLRKAQGLGTVEMAERAGITRNTLRSVECGDPGPAIGTYLRVMSILGVSADFALLASDTLQAPPPGSAAARSRFAAPVVQVRVSADEASHRLQDLQSLALHEEAVRLAKSVPALVLRAQDTVSRWLATGDARSASLWREWQVILDTGAWRKVLGRTRRAQQLRQASPLVTVLPEEARQRILKQVSQLKAGVVIEGASRRPEEESGPEAPWRERNSNTSPAPAVKSPINTNS